MTLRLLALLAALAPLAAGAADPAPPVGAASSPAAWSNGWARGAVFYEVFVRSFADSDGDGTGDLRGLTAKLDELNDGDPATTGDLGVDALWLMPIFPSPSYHGYDTTDYEDINPDYGTLADFDRLVKEAHRRGIRVILDLVVNHTSTQHPWFQDARSSAKAVHRDWYVWSQQDPGWHQPWGQDPVWHRDGSAYYYALFWDQMPDLDFRNPEVRAEIRRIAKLWLDRGVDGFRLDAARHLVEDGDGDGQCDTAGTRAAWAEFAAYVRSAKPDAVLVGELWTSTRNIAPYYGDGARVVGGDGLPMAFDFPLATATIAALRTGAPEGIATTLAEVQRLYPKGALDAPFLTNHDHIRVATQLEGHPGKLRAAAGILLTLPGAPFVYYGEELGLVNGPGTDDPQKRTPMPWDATKGGGFTTGRPWFPFAPGREVVNVAVEKGDPRSLRSRYRDLIAVRHRSEALREGALELLPGAGRTLAFVRRAGGQTVVVLQNVGEGAEEAGPYALPDGALRPLFADPGVGAPVTGPKGVTVKLPPHGTAIFEFARATPR
ncbi:MAG: alpha-amylase family glycosyl hydrolase [Anaeromyxobacter sp.]